MNLRNALVSVAELSASLDRAEEAEQRMTTIKTRTFDLGKTYYLSPDRKRSEAFNGSVNEFLASLPPYAPVKVSATRPDSDGDVWVNTVSSLNHGGYVLAEYILDDIPGAAEVRPVKKGDRVMILRAYRIDDLVRAHIYGIAEEDEDDPREIGRLLFRFDNPFGHWSGHVTWYADEWTLDVADDTDSSAVEPTESAPEETVTRSVAELSASLDRAEEARQAALADLESFKRQVRENVIYQHQSKGWLDEHVNDLLESLELDPIKPAYDGPVHVGSIIKLKDGRIAVICDRSDEPFRAVYPSGEGYDEWLSVADVARIGVEREFHDNEDFSELHIQV